MKKILLLFSTILLSMATVLAGDILTLKDNMAFEGSIVKIKGCDIVFKVKRTRYVVPAADIFSIQFEDVNNPIYLDYLDQMEVGDKCLRGTTDAQQLHGKKAGHFVLGFLFGPFAMIGTALSHPTPFRSMNAMTMSQNKDLFTDPEYLICYKKKAKKVLIGMEAIGWGVFLIIYYASGGGN